MNYKNPIKIFIIVALLVVPVSVLGQESLLIIAPDEFIDALGSLKRFKDASGRPATLLGLTQVYNNFSGLDEPEKIKRCIAHYEEHSNVDFVLLVGDIDKFPVRWTWNCNMYTDEGYKSGFWEATDHYYADLYKNGTKIFDNWDSNGNGLYGEVEFAPYGSINNDHIDFLPDVAVGRIPASTGEEVAAYINKVINYELKTMPSDTWFKNAALYTGTWKSSHNGVKNNIGDFLENKGFTLIKRYSDFSGSEEDWTPPPGVPVVIIEDINSGVGVVNYLGHGSEHCWVDLLCSSAIVPTPQHIGLSNIDLLPVIFAGACETGRYALSVYANPYVDVNGGEHCGLKLGEVFNPGPYPHSSLPRPAPVQDDGGNGKVLCDGTWYGFDPDCLAERFLFGNPTGPTGAIAYLGERGPGQKTVVDLDRHFFRAYENGHTVLGEMWKYMMEEYYDQHDLGNSHNWEIYPDDWIIGHRFTEPQKLHVFGDPSLVLGGAYTNARSGPVWDGWGGPWLGYSRYRVSDDITVPAGVPLTVNPYSSALFESTKKITAMGIDPAEGFIVNGTSDMPVHFMSLSADPQPEHVVRGIRIRGQLRLRNGGEIKLF